MIDFEFEKELKEFLKRKDYGRNEVVIIMNSNDDVEIIELDEYAEMLNKDFKELYHVKD